MSEEQEDRKVLNILRRRKVTGESEKIKEFAFYKCMEQWQKLPNAVKAVYKARGYKNRQSGVDEFLEGCREEQEEYYRKKYIKKEKRS